MAVWIDPLDNLAALNRARSRAVTAHHQEGTLGVAHHQVDVYLFDKSWTDYAGRLCTYGQCPKGKVDCLTPGCGSQPFLKQHRDFALGADALAGGRSVLLYEREHGVVSRACDLGEVIAPGPDTSDEG